MQITDKGLPQPHSHAAAASDTAAQPAVPRYGWAMALIAVLFAVLGMVYNLTTPIFEAPDETSHFLYVKYLADGNGPPPLVYAEDDVGQGEMHQPPLYYALGALLIRGIDTGTPAEAFERNPYAALGLADAGGNVNATIHDDAERTLQGVPLAVHLLRLYSTILSAGTVILTHRVAREILPHRPLISVGAAALVAFNPQFVFVSAAVSNDAMATLCATAVLYSALRVCNGQARHATTPLVIGVLVGLATLSKVSAAAVSLLVPLAYLFAYWQVPAKNRRPWRQVIRPTLCAALAAAAVGGWWYYRNAAQYGDPFAMGALQAIFGIYDEPLSLGQTLRVMGESLVSYYGVFGWMNVLADEAYYVFVRIVTILGIVGLALAGAWTLWRRPAGGRRPWPAATLAVMWVLVMLASYAQFTRTVTSPQGRLLFPASAAIALFLCIGLSAWLPRRYNAWLTGALASTFVLASALMPFRYIAPAYAQPTRVSLDDAPQDMSDLAINFDDQLFLLGYRLDQQTSETGEALHIRLYWLATRKLEEDLTVSIRVYGRRDEVIGTLDSYPGMGKYPTSRWIPGEVIFDDCVIPIAQDATTPAAASIRLGVYHREDLTHLEAVDARGVSIGTGPEIARVRITAPEGTQPTPQHALHTEFADQIVLEGYDLANDIDRGERILRVTLYWRSAGPITEDWTVFAHLLDENGQLVAQVDEQPLGGEYPTTYWELGEQVRDSHILLIPDNLPAGEYTLHLGFYLLASGDRLPVVNDQPGLTYAIISPVPIQSR